MVEYNLHAVHSHVYSRDGEWTEARQLHTNNNKQATGGGYKSSSSSSGSSSNGRPQPDVVYESMSVLFFAYKISQHIRRERLRTYLSAHQLGDQPFVYCVLLAMSQDICAYSVLHTYICVYVYISFWYVCMSGMRSTMDP